jgi:hypothetical protein
MRRNWSVPHRWPQPSEHDGFVIITADSAGEMVDGLGVALLQRSSQTG